ncbi:MAG: metal dependent phosphohydrolase, partial [Chthonomonadaceae bacterium]|nr:metal dependent phosphohydrolase [Chthonomonadaceae bacterium]
AEQSLRLAALLHDLGHLPFSHDFEFAIEELLAAGDVSRDEHFKLKQILEAKLGSSALHERLGQGLGLNLMKDLVKLFGDSAGTLDIVFTLAFKILTTSADIPHDDQTRALEFLHAIIAGEVDADRCDFVFRDGRNYGFEFATYDLNRILQNVTVVGGKRFEICFRPQGVSAIESFILARCRSYQYGVRHHKVAQIAAALRHSLIKLLNHPSFADEVKPFLNDVKTLAAHDEQNPEDRSRLLDRFANYDDTWCIQLLRRLATSAPDDWLELVCWRKKEPKSLWKRAAEFPLDDRVSLRDWNVALLERDAGPVAATEWHDAISKLDENHVLIMRHKFKPWGIEPNAGQSGDTPKSSLRIYYSHANIQPVSEVSPIIRELRNAWLDDVHVHAFATPDSVFWDDPAGVVQQLPVNVETKEANSDAESA